jgi:hypothetical protein
MPAHGNRSPMSGSKKAVFMSYASEDAAAAERICASLRAAGIEVWFDQTERSRPIGGCWTSTPGHAYALNNLGRLQLLNGQPTQALLTFKRVEIDEMRLMGISISKHTLGHKIESQQSLDALIAKGAADWAYQIGEVYAWRGENDKAFEWLERAYAQRDSAIPGLKVSPIIQFSSLPKDPRYSALLRRLKLPV